jgi:hypothetical protein
MNVDAESPVGRVPLTQVMFSRVIPLACAAVRGNGGCLTPMNTDHVGRIDTAAYSKQKRSRKPSNITWISGALPTGLSASMFIGVHLCQKI